MTSSTNAEFATAYASGQLRIINEPTNKCRYGYRITFSSFLYKLTNWSTIYPVLFARSKTK
jgi:hypothetical protein